MRELREEKKLRQYIVSEAFLKEKLDILGDIASIGLYSGLSPNDEKAGVPHDKITWEIRTVQTSTETQTQPRVKTDG